MKKSKRILAIGAAMATSAGALFGLGACGTNTQNTDQTPSTDNQQTINPSIIENMQDKIDELEQSIKDNQSKLEQLEGELGQANDDIDNLQNQINAINNLISSLTTLYNDIINKYAEISADLKSFKDLTDLDLASLKNTVASYETTLKSLQEQLNNIGVVNADELKALIEKNQNSINALKVMSSIAYTLDDNIHGSFEYTIDGNTGNYEAYQTKDGDYYISGDYNGRSFEGVNYIGYSLYKLGDREYLGGDVKTLTEWASEGFVQANDKITANGNTYTCESTDGTAKFVVNIGDDYEVNYISYTDSNESFHTNYIESIDEFNCEKMVKMGQQSFDTVTKIDAVVDAVNKTFDNKYIMYEQTNADSTTDGGTFVASRNQVALKGHYENTNFGNQDIYYLGGTNSGFDDNSILIYDYDGEIVEQDIGSTTMPAGKEWLKQSYLLTLREGATDIVRVNDNEYEIWFGENDHIKLFLDEDGTLVETQYRSDIENNTNTNMKFTKITKAEFEAFYEEVSSFVYDYKYGKESTL